MNSRVAKAAAHATGFFSLRVVTDRCVGSYIEVLSRDNASQREQRAPPRLLPTNKYVWNNIVLLATEHGSCAAKSMDLIQNQQCSMPVACRAHLFPIIARWYNAGVAHRFCNYRAHIALFLQHIFNEVGAAKIAGAVAAEQAGLGVRRRYVLGPWQQRADA